MTNIESIYSSNHTDQQTLLLSFSVVFLLLTAVPRQERVLFVNDGSGLKAFGAQLPPYQNQDYTDFLPGFLRPFAPRSFFARTPRSAGFGAVSTPPDAAVAGSPFSAPDASLAAPGDTAPPAAFAPGTTPLSTGPGSGGGNAFPFAPPSLGVPGSSPAVPVTSILAAPPVVAAVPEPATWSMLIVGFLSVGMVLRRRSNRRKAPAVFLTI